MRGRAGWAAPGRAGQLQFCREQEKAQQDGHETPLRVQRERREDVTPKLSVCVRASGVFESVSPASTSACVL